MKSIHIAFNIFSCRILIISYEMLIITEISNEKTNELTIFAMLCQNVTMFYRQKLASLFQVQEKMKSWRNSKRNISSSCFIADNSHKKCVATCSVANESTSKLLLFFQLLKSNRFTSFKFSFVLDK